MPRITGYPLGIAVLALSACLPGCSEDPAGPNGETPAVTVPDWTYIQGKYFFITDPDSALPAALEEQLERPGLDPEFPAVPGDDAGAGVQLEGTESIGDAVLPAGIR